MRTKKSILLKALALCFLTFTTVSCESDDDSNPELNTFYGDSEPLGNAAISAFVTVDEENNPVEIGVVFPETALNGLSDEMQHFTIELPEEAAPTPFKHISFDWNPQGHEPNGIYNLPHFDIHFNMITSTERMQIGVNDPLSEELPEDRFMPASFIPLPGSVPMMGKHWADPDSPELNGEVFTETFLMGSYNEKVIFYEPMITVEYLKTRPSKVVDLELPEAYHQAGKYYPTQYRISYDAAKKIYTISLPGLTKRQ